MIPDLPTYLLTPSWSGLASLVLTVVLPLLAALLVKQSWSPTIKGLVLLGLSAVKAVVEAFIAQGSFHIGPAVQAVALNFGFAVVAYFGLLKGSTLHTAVLNSGNTDADPAAPDDPPPNLA